MIRAKTILFPIALFIVACDSEPADSDSDEAAPSELREGAGEAHGKKARHLGKRGGEHRKDPAERAAKMMARLDADGDGAISLAEAQGHRLADKFASADADGDGKLTKEELIAFKRAHRRGEKLGTQSHG